MAHIDYFLSPISPFTYLAGNRLEEVAQKHGASVTYKPLGLAQVFAQTGGTAVGERHPSRQAWRLQELERIGKMNKMPITIQPAFFPTNPVPAMSAIHAAQEAGGGDLAGLCQSLLRACWLEEKNIAEDDVVGACLEANGYSKGLIISGMLAGSEAVERNTNEALERGVFGSPSYLIDDQVFFGQDRVAHLDAYLTEKG